YAAVTYHHTQGPEAVWEHIKLSGRIPRWKKSTLELALQSAFLCGDDSLAQQISESAISRFPESQVALIVLSDIARFHGHYEDALRWASRAWFETPASDDAASRVVELTARIGAHEEREGVALAALEIFPRSSKVLWAVCKACSSPDYFESIHQTWYEQVKRHNDIAQGVRQMANAALRAERFDTALEIYSHCCLLEIGGLVIGKKLPQKQLEGKKSL